MLLVWWTKNVCQKQRRDHFCGLCVNGKMAMYLFVHWFCCCVNFVLVLMRVIGCCFFFSIVRRWVERSKFSSIEISRLSFLNAYVLNRKISLCWRKRFYAQIVPLSIRGFNVCCKLGLNWMRSWTKNYRWSQYAFFVFGIYRRVFVCLALWFSLLY